jgi:hypothetical protein
LLLILTLDKFLQVALRIADLQKRPDLYLGVHEPGRRYEKGSFVSEAGSLLACLFATTQKPGDSPAWQLAVKRGRDGR